MVEEPIFRSLAQYGTKPPRIRSPPRPPALLSQRTMGRLSVGATFQLGAKFGAGRSGGMRNAILISLKSVESLTRPHITQHYHIIEADPERMLARPVAGENGIADRTVMWLGQPQPLRRRLRVFKVLSVEDRAALVVVIRDAVKAHLVIVFGLGQLLGFFLGGQHRRRIRQFKSERRPSVAAQLPAVGPEPLRADLDTYVFGNLPSGPLLLCHQGNSKRPCHDENNKRTL